MQIWLKAKTIVNEMKIEDFAETIVGSQIFETIWLSGQSVLITPNDEKKIQNFSTVCGNEVGNCGFLSNAAYLCKKLT